MRQPTAFEKMRANRRRRALPTISRAQREQRRDELVMLGLSSEDAELVAWDIKKLDEVAMEGLSPSVVDALIPPARPRRIGLVGWMLGR